MEQVRGAGRARERAGWWGRGTGLTGKVTYDHKTEGSERREWDWWRAEGSRPRGESLQRPRGRESQGHQRAAHGGGRRARRRGAGGHVREEAGCQVRAVLCEVRTPRRVFKQRNDVIRLIFYKITLAFM